MSNVSLKSMNIPKILFFFFNSVLLNMMKLIYYFSQYVSIYNIRNTCYLFFLSVSYKDSLLFIKVD